MSKPDKKIKLPENAVGVIYAGGSGTRLWPISTKSNPKQINPLFSKETMLIKAYKRARHLFPKEKIIIVLTVSLYKKVRSLVKLPEKNFLVQPNNADTAPAMGLTALYVETLFPNSVAVTFYSDQIIKGMKEYTDVIGRAISMAHKTRDLLTIGTKPLYPSVDFGYIKLGRPLSGKMTYKVGGFVEKPNEEQANKMIKSGEYVWNTGVYVWHAEALLRIFKEVSPDIYDALVKLKSVILSKKFGKELDKWYEKVRAEPFDKAISEKTKDLVVLVSEFTWKDVGNWKTVYEISKKDKDKNAILSFNKDRVVSIDSSGCLIIPAQSRIALVGVKDLIVVQTKDLLLIAHKDQAAKVKIAAKK